MQPDHVTQRYQDVLGREWNIAEIAPSLVADDSRVLVACRDACLSPTGRLLRSAAITTYGVPPHEFDGERALQSFQRWLDRTDDDAIVRLRDRKERT